MNRSAYINKGYSLIAIRNISIAVMAVIAAALVRLLLLGALETRVVWVTFYPAVMIASLFGGLYTGILVAVLSCLTAVYGWPVFVDRPFIKDYADWLGLAAFFINCGMIAGVSEAMRRARSSANNARKEAEAAREQAVAANNAKSVFLANMSHDLRTPLNAILGFSSLMRNDPGLTEEQRKTLDIINRSGDHLLNLINDVLDMAKVEARRVNLENAPFDLGETIRDITDLLRERAGKKGLQLLLDQSSAFPRFVQSDSAILRRILINLVGNAIKYTEMGQVTLRLNTCPADEPERLRLIIEVEDTGVGISEEDQKLIFEPFVQAGRNSAEKGTGLGLAITRQYIELMEGRLSVESTPGKGSIFRVELPVLRIEETNLPSAMAIHNRVVSLEPDQREWRVLIVEDQVENWMLLQRTLESVGFKVSVAQNGAEGVDAFQKWKPDFIWMDCRMPVMDGTEASKRIRALDGGQEVKIVALTASVFKEEREKIMSAGMDDFMRKPFRVSEIYESMEKHLGVKYIYADMARQPVAGQSETIDIGALANLSQNLRDELMNALVHLDTEEVAHVINRIADLNPAVARNLSEYAGGYKYSAIMRELRASNKEQP